MSRKYIKLKKQFKFYDRYFDFKEPYTVLLDGTLVTKAVVERLNLNEYIIGYFHCHTEPNIVTTKCIINEAKQLRAGGNAIFVESVTKLSKNQRFDCKHTEPYPSARDCILSLVNKGNPSHLFIGTNDSDLVRQLKHKACVPILSIEKKFLYLRPMSKITKNSVEHPIDKIQKNEEAEIDRLKKLLNVHDDFESTQTQNRTKNMLNNDTRNMKSKESTSHQQIKNSSKIKEKKKRIRLKLSKHVREEILNRQ